MYDSNNKDYFFWFETNKIDDENFRSLYFFDPVKIIKLDNPENLKDFFQELEDLAKKYYVAGFFSYELGYFLEEAFNYMQNPSFPLALFCAYDEPVIYDHRLERFTSGNFDIPQNPSLFDITSEFSSFINQYTTSTRKRTDIAQIASSAAIECLTDVCAKETGDLFETPFTNVRESLKRLSTKTNFSKLGHEFFSRFTFRYVSYLLSRELSNHVGADNRFKTLENRRNFNNALNLHCRQATRIIDEFAGGWYSKNGPYQ